MLETALEALGQAKGPYPFLVSEALALATASQSMSSFSALNLPRVYCNVCGVLQLHTLGKQERICKIPGKELENTVTPSVHKYSDAMNAKTALNGIKWAHIGPPRDCLQQHIPIMSDPCLPGRCEELGQWMDDNGQVWRIAASESNAAPCLSFCWSVWSVVIHCWF